MDPYLAKLVGLRRIRQPHQIRPSVLDSPLVTERAKSIASGPELRSVSAYERRPGELTRWLSWPGGACVGVLDYDGGSQNCDASECLDLLSAGTPRVDASGLSSALPPLPPS